MGDLFRPLRHWATHSATVRRWRERRYALFTALCDVRPDDQILDVGAGGGGALERFNDSNPIMALDLQPRAGEWLAGKNVTILQGDGCALPFADDAFDVVFSNSVIEHVPQELQSAFADEIRRVAPRYFVQTPNRYFPIEPHYQVPFFQFLPRRAQRALSSRFSLGWRGKGGGEEITLLTAKDLRRLFPDAEIHRERLLGLTKSLMAVHR